MDQQRQRLCEERFEQIVGESHLRFGRIARAYAGEEAEDLAQEMLLQIWRSLPSYDERATLSTWSYRIALNTAISWRRRVTRSKRQPPPQRCPTDSLVSNTDFSDDGKLLQRFLNTLSEIDRAVIIMVLDDFSHQEIASSLGVNPGTIRTRISRIRKRLENWESDDGPI